MEIHKESTENIFIASKVFEQGYRIGDQYAKLNAFLHTYSEKSENKIKKITPFIIASI